MREIAATISSKGQITLPVAVRRLLRVGPRDRVVFSIEDDQVRLIPAAYTLESALGSVPPIATDDDLEGQIEDAREERVQRLVAELEQG